MTSEPDKVEPEIESSATAVVAEGEVVFGSFRLSADSLTLTDDGRPVALGDRALRVLAVLARRPGEVISQDQLIAAAWPGLTVLPDNLRVQISGLRRVLNRGGSKDAIIINVPGRGYQFAGGGEAVPAPGRSVHADRLARSVPAPLVRVIGRGVSVQAVRDSVERNRVTTVVGPGGIGKTTVALSAVRDMDFPSIWFVDLGRVVDLGGIAGAVATAFGIALPTTTNVEALLAYLKHAPGLLILDNCEHLISGCAALVELLSSRLQNLTILATSRHPLKVVGEAVYKLYPLELPPRATITLAEAQTYPAVQLLAERIVMTGLVSNLSDADAPNLADICRRLDGLPLAIELAAATVGMLGVPGTAARLRERFDGLREGRSTAPLRQRTLWATFAWSYELLSPLEQSILRRVSFLKAAASAEEILRLCVDVSVGESEITASLVQLVEKSLINVDVSGDIVIYSMLQTTREFARDATPEPEAWAISARHADLVLSVMSEALAAWRFRDRQGWIKRYDAYVDDAAAAFAWGLSETANLHAAVQLLTQALPFLFYTSRSYIAADWSTELSRRAAVAEVLDPREELAIMGALAVCNTYVPPVTPSLRDTWRTMLAKAEALQDLDAIMLAQWGLWICATFLGGNAEMQIWARAFLANAEARGSRADIRSGLYLMAQSLFSCGDIAAALNTVEEGLLLDEDPKIGLGVVRCQFDPETVKRGLRARILWLVGRVDEAAVEAHKSMDAALRGAHAISISQACMDAGQVLLLMGDTKGATAAFDRHLAALAEVGLTASPEASYALRAALQVETGHAIDAARLAPILQPTNTVPRRFPSVMGILAIALGRSGDVATGLAFMDHALRDADMAHWCSPEHLRARAALRCMAADGAPDPLAGRDLEWGLELARQRGAVSWEVRIVIDLARYRETEGRLGEAIDLATCALKSCEKMPASKDRAALARLCDELQVRFRLQATASV